MTVVEKTVIVGDKHDHDLVKHDARLNLGKQAEYKKLTADEAKSLAEQVLGLITGTRVGSFEINAQCTLYPVQYVGIGPLIVKTIRGEIKAESGDLIMMLVNESGDPDVPADPPYYLWVMPHEIATALGEYEPAPPVADEESVMANKSVSTDTSRGTLPPMKEPTPSHKH